MFSIIIVTSTLAQAQPSRQCLTVSYCAAAGPRGFGSYPKHVITGSVGYFGNRGSVAARLAQINNRLPIGADDPHVLAGCTETNILDSVLLCAHRLPIDCQRAVFLADGTRSARRIHWRYDRRG
jgi:hypothetical protein